jgi:hypothetical protein
VLTRQGLDPSASGDLVAWQAPNGAGMLGRAGGGVAPLPGAEPAIGGPFIAWRMGTRVSVLRLLGGGTVAEARIPGVDELAVSPRWLVYRKRTSRGDVIAARSLPRLGRERVLARGGRTVPIGRPTVHGNRVAFHVASARGSRLVELDARTRRGRLIRQSSTVRYLHPVRRGGSILYVRLTRCGQELRLLRGRRDRVLLRTRPFVVDYGPSRGCTRRRRTTRTLLWTTALSDTHAYVTRIVPRPGRAPRASILSVDR